MTTEYYGNSIPAPGSAVKPVTVDTEVLYSMKNYTQKGVTLKAGQGVLPAGTFLKQDPATKKYVKATTAPEGVLRATTDTGTDAAAQSWMGNLILAGFLKYDMVSNANSGVTLTSVLNAQVNTVLGFFKF